MPTIDKLISRGLIIPNRCCLCSADAKSLEHLSSLPLGWASLVLFPKVVRDYVVSVELCQESSLLLVRSVYQRRE